jgi:hypothetical protein
LAILERNFILAAVAVDVMQTERVKPLKVEKVVRGLRLLPKKGGSYLGGHADADGGSPGGGYGGGGGGTATKESPIATGAQGVVIIRDAR